LKRARNNENFKEGGEETQKMMRDDEWIVWRANAPHPFSCIYMGHHRVRIYIVNIVFGETAPGLLPYPPPHGFDRQN
jgi:hypothetical protein